MWQDAYELRRAPSLDALAWYPRRDLDRARHMGWIVAAVFAATIALLYTLYRRALNEAAGANALLILVLLDAGVHDAQRDSLVDFVAKTPATNALEFSQKAQAAFSAMAAKFAESSLLGVQGNLWKFKQHVDARSRGAT